MVNIEYLRCPLCGMNRSLYKNKKKVGFFRFNPDYDVIEVRSGGGYKSGFHRVDNAGSDLRELRTDDPELFANLFTEAQRLHTALEEAMRGG